MSILKFKARLGWARDKILRLLRLLLQYKGPVQPLFQNAGELSHQVIGGAIEAKPPAQKLWTNPLMW